MAVFSELASVSATKRILDCYGLTTKKGLGQHFLINDGVVKRICALAELSDADTVVEVGPGIGTLTLALLKETKAVIAIERDEDLIPVLHQTLEAHADNLYLIQKDALAVQEADFMLVPNKLVANLPYAVAATVVLDFFERFSFITSATVMVQSEVADRMCAHLGTKNYGAYTVKLGLFCVCRDKFSVSEGNFFPPPRVKSTVIRLDRQNLCIEDKVIKATMLMADAAFANRRKTILNSMRSYFSQWKEKYPVVQDQLELLLRSAHIDPAVRGEALSQEDYLRLGKVYQELFGVGGGI